MTAIMLTPIYCHAAVAWDESTNGDLSSGYPGTDLGVLGAGTWDILGHLDGGGPDIFGGADEFDLVQFAASGPWTFGAVGLSLDSSSAFVVVVERPIDDYVTSRYVYAPTTDLFGALPAGSYRLSLLPGANAGTLSYAGRISVIPEPTAFTLLGLGSVALVLVRRRG